jgi:hypothetical protein
MGFPVAMYQRQVHWPSSFYFYCKYSFWFGLIGANITGQATTKVDCQALVSCLFLYSYPDPHIPLTQYNFTQFTINTATGSASTLLMLRTIAVWNRAPLVTVPLVAASLCQWGVLFYNMTTVRGGWSDFAGRCLVNPIPPAHLESMYLCSESSPQFCVVFSPSYKTFF